MKRQEQLSFDELEVIRNVTSESFWAFTQVFWSSVVAEVPVWNWHIPFLCNELQVIAERVFRGEPKEYDEIINISPGTTKSTVASILFQPWTLSRMPSARHLNGSHTEQLVLDLSRKSRDVVRSELYQKVFPHVQIREDQDTKSYWLTKEGGGRFGTTVGGKSPMGMHAHFITIDDPIDPQKAISVKETARANRWMDRTLPTRKVDKLLTPTILIMQRLAQDDPTGHTLHGKASKIRWVCLPAELSDEVRPRILRKKYHEGGGLMDPVRLSKKALQEHKNRGAYYYASQFMQTPIPEGGGMFKTHRLHNDLKAPPRRLFRRLVRYWDKASTAGGGTYTVGLLMAVDTDGRYWVLDVIRVQLDSNEREQLILQTARLDGLEVVVGVEQEPGSGGKDSALDTVRRLAGFRVSINRPSGSDATKLLRADPFSVQVNAGNVYLEPQEWNREYVDEMKFFPFSKFKDQVDASSGAFAELSKPILEIGAF